MDAILSVTDTKVSQNYLFIAMVFTGCESRICIKALPATIMALYS
jgi:hypothetical protein